ncbi:sericin 1-like [Cherax quadricarinatus]
MVTWAVIAVLSMTTVTAQNLPSYTSPNSEIIGRESIRYSLLPSGGVFKKFGSDRSYSFNYETPTSSRSEDADSSLNVKGRYSFTGNDGRTRTVSYTAGSETGFVAEADFLPVAPTTTALSAAAPAAAVLYSTLGTQGEAKVRSSSSPDGSYSFGYEAPSSSRSEDADSNLNVKGRYSFQADDGRTRIINYRAGSGTGFIAEGDFLPVAPEASVGSAAAPNAAVLYSVDGTQGEAKIRSSSSPDGSYSFNYEAPSSSRSEEADSRLNVKGMYSFQADDGRKRTINYRAGSETGFIAEGDLPVAPEASVGSAASPEAAVLYSVAETPGEAKMRSSSSPDGSYSFGYEAPSSSRSEVADSRLNVKGKYSFQADDGQTRTIKYQAGSETGFVAEGDLLPVAPKDFTGSAAFPGAAVLYSTLGTQGEAKVRSSSSPDGSYSFGYEAPRSSRSEDADSSLNVKGKYSFQADDGRIRTINYRAGSGTGFVAEGDFLPVAPEASVESAAAPEAAVSYSPAEIRGKARAKSIVSRDGSYSFNYEAPSSSRSEDADSNLNVKGRYSFQADDGRTRTINYRAGSGTGFIAEGDFLPVAPKASVGLAAAPDAAVLYSIDGTQGEAKVRSSSLPDGSYSFNYEAPSSSRSEEADSRLNVKGKYSFQADDGRTRTINYRAGSKTGFIAEGDLPVAPEASVGSPAAPDAAVLYSIDGTQGEAKVRSYSLPDGSYSFNYEAPSSSRSEDADSNLNVKGRYSFQADDGRTRTINYRAGSETGFIAEGDFLPVAPEASVGPPASPEAAVLYSVAETPGEAKMRSSSSPDGSYSFGYEAPSSSRSEVADSRLNVKGKYSFQADDGQTRTIKYQAGSETGFVAEGDLLPVAPKDFTGSAAFPGAAVLYSTLGTQGEAKVRSSSSPDGSYSFGYEAPRSSRSEDADSSLNVKGKYSFQADDGRIRTINYRAGSGTGFVAEGDFLPVAPEASVGSAAAPEAADSYSAAETRGKARAKSIVSSDGSYSFNYEAPSSSRSEDADSNLNVKGRYSFQADDGRTRTINYRAGSGTGFIAEGDFLPVAPKASVGLAAAPDAAVLYSIDGTQGEAKVRSSSSPDGSYSFGYEAPRSSRSEDADSSLNVKGKYSFQADDGRTRTINYRAGSGTGFIAEGDFLPVAPEASVGSAAAPDAAVLYSVDGTQGEVKVRSSSSPDGSYSFNYEAPSSSRSEEADSNLNVKGRYSFRADDGRTRTINYKAGSKIGFIAEGDTLLVAS